MSWDIKDLKDNSNVENNKDFQKVIKMVTILDGKQLPKLEDNEIRRKYYELSTKKGKVSE